VNRPNGLVETFQHGPVDTYRREVAVDGTWPLVEALRDLIELLLAADGQVRAFREVLAQEAVGVLAEAALPGAMRVAEIDLDPGLGGQLGMARHLFTLVIGQRLAHRCRNAAELKRIARQGGGGGSIIHLSQQHQAEGAFDQDPHRRAVTRPLEEVAFPVAGQNPVIHLRRTHMNANHISQLPTPIRTPGAWQASAVGLAQAGDQFLAQGTPGQGVEAGVDGLGGNPPVRGVRPHHFHGASDLTGRPTLLQQMLDHTKQHAIHRQLRRPPRLEAAAPGFLAGQLGVIAASPRGTRRWDMPAPLPADRRGARRRVRAMARRLFPSLAINMIVARSSADSCS